MLRLNSNQDTFKITGASFKKDDFEKTVEIKVLTVTKSSDNSNVGNILEKYRATNAEKKKYFQENKDTLDKFINLHAVPFDDFIPDSVICILPNDKNRKELLLSFRSKVQGESNPKDYSYSFTKKDKNKSIKEHNLSVSDFELKIDKDGPFQNLLILDDVIDEGKTLNILLELLLEKGLINNKTNIKMSCIYNRPKLEKRENPMDAFRKIVKKNNL